MVQFNTVTSVVLLQLAFLARVTVSLPVLSTATLESRALSTNDEENNNQQLSKRVDVVTCAGIFLAGFCTGALASKPNWDYLRGKKTPPANEPPVEPPAERPGSPHNSDIELASLRPASPGSQHSDPGPPGKQIRRPEAIYVPHGHGWPLTDTGGPPASPHDGDPSSSTGHRHPPNNRRPSTPEQAPVGDTRDRSDGRFGASLQGPRRPEPVRDGRPPFSRRPSGLSRDSSSTTLNQPPPLPLSHHGSATPLLKKTSRDGMF